MLAISIQILLLLFCFLYSRFGNLLIHKDCKGSYFIMVFHLQQLLSMLNMSIHHHKCFSVYMILNIVMISQCWCHILFKLSVQIQHMQPQRMPNMIHRILDFQPKLLLLFISNPNLQEPYWLILQQNYHCQPQQQIIPMRDQEQQQKAYQFISGSNQQSCQRLEYRISQQLQKWLIQINRQIF